MQKNKRNVCQRSDGPCGDLPEMDIGEEQRGLRQDRSCTAQVFDEHKYVGNARKYDP